MARNGTRKGNHKKRGFEITSASSFTGQNTSPVTSGLRPAPEVTKDVVNSTASKKSKQGQSENPSRYAGLFGSPVPSGSNSWPRTAGGIVQPSTDQQSPEASSASAAAERVGKSAKKRLLLMAGSVATLTAAGVFTAGATFGFFKATVVQTDNFSSGTVTIASTAGGTCSTPNMFPGITASPCILSVNYGGTTVPVYLGLDVLIETQAGNGGTPLYNPHTDPTNSLQVTITSTNPTVTYTVPATALPSCPGSPPSGSTCYEADDQLVSTGTITSSSPNVIFSTTAGLPSTALTGYRGGEAQIILTVHAVQSKNNNFVGGCTVGTTCGTTGNWK